MGLTSVDTATAKLHFENPFPLEKNSGLLNGSPQEARGTDWQLRSTVQKVSWNLPIKGILITPSPEALGWVSHPPDKDAGREHK